MNSLNLIGYWNDTEFGIKRYIDPNELKDHHWDPQLKEQILSYLRNGFVLRSFLGFSWCRIDKSIPNSEMGCSEITDGKFIWPTGLALYLDKFNVELPSEFVENAIKTQFQIKFLTRLRLKMLKRKIEIHGSGELVDDSFWVSWCQSKTELITENHKPC